MREYADDLFIIARVVRDHPRGQIIRRLCAFATGDAQRRATGSKLLHQYLLLVL